MNTGYKRIALSLFAAYSMTLAGCSTTPEAPTSSNGNATPQAERFVDAEGEWVLNRPWQRHTHHVNLPDCPEVKTITHVHGASQSQVGYHQHQGCLVCPPGKGVKRILE